MQKTRRSRLRWLTVMLAALAAFALVAAACGDDDDDDNGDNVTAPTATATEASGNGDNGDDNGNSGEIDYGELSGQVRVDGSSTVLPVSEAMAEEFSFVSDVRVNVASSGSGGGFEKFCRGEIEISDASRPIQDDEVEACAENGIEDIVEIQVAIDALTVMVNPGNDWATCMTVEQLNQAFRADGATTWADIDPSWPDDDIVFYYPGADSGTFDYFNEAIIEEFEGSTHRTDGSASEDDNVLALGIEGDTNAIGYFGFAYYLAAGDTLNAVEVDNGDGCVAPSFETALAGEYEPLSRPLFIYTTETLLEERPEVLGFIKFYLDNVGDIVPDVGYITMPDDQQEAQLAKIEPFLP